MMHLNWIPRHSTIAAWSCICVLAPGTCGGQSRPERSVDDAIRPNETIALFNGRDLSGWYSYLVDAKHEDPRKVFTVEKGVIRISGEGLGYLSTKQSFHDYRLLVEFRWGERNWGERQGKARDSGVFLHGRGPDGNSVDAAGAYKAAVECQVMEGAVGDILLIKGHDHSGKVLPFRVATTVSSAQDADGWPFYLPEGKLKTLHHWGRVNWRNKSPQWKDEFGFRGASDVEKRAGEWNRLEYICDEDRIEIWLNGDLVNEAHDVSPTSGNILLQCEGSEVYYRHLELHPLKRKDRQQAERQPSARCISTSKVNL